MMTEVLQQKFYDSFSSDVRALSKEEEGTWRDVLQNLPYIPVAYTLSSLEYQSCYMKAFVEDLIDVSIILCHKGDPIGIWPLSLRKENGRYLFATNQGSVLPPVYREGVSERLVKKYDAACLDAMQRFYTDSLAEVSLEEQWEGQASLLPSRLEWQNKIWEQKCMERGAKAFIAHDLYVNLSMTVDDIHKRLRKSYRSLLHEGEHLWDIEIHDKLTPELFDEYRLLHKSVSGRVTRPLETWELQRRAVNEGEGFLVTLRDGNERLIGGGLFSLSPDEGLYAVGAYDRSLFDQPVSHIVQWTAIKHLKELGRQWHYVGQRFYSGDCRKPTDKELSIAYFKEGFATDVFLRIITANSLEGRG